MQHLFVSDLDHTLLDNDANLSDFSRATLIRLLQRGLRFTVATARSAQSLKRPLEGLPLHLPVIELNGAYLTEFETGHHLHVQAIPAPVLEELVSSLRGRPDLFLLSFDGVQDHLSYAQLTNPGQRWYVTDRETNGDNRLRPTPDIWQHLQEQVVCLTLIDREAVLRPVLHQLETQFSGRLNWVIYENQYQPGWFWLNIQDRGASKAHAIEWLLARLDMGSQQLTVFGDQVNDISMFHLAGQAYAVANAVPELKALATDILESNQDDAVVKYILEHWDGV